MTDETPAVTRVRQPPPPFRRVEVRQVTPVTPRLTRVTLAGSELEGLSVDEPAASVRLLIPHPGGDLVMPEWNGNEFLEADGSRPAIRTFTPRRFDPMALELDLEVVVHETGAASDWVRRAGPGDPAAVSGTGRGYTVDPAVRRYLLAGDETAVPAISQLLETFDRQVEVAVIVEVADPSSRPPMPAHPGSTVEWVVEGDSPGRSLVEAVTAAAIPDGSRVWVAGEAAAVQRIRRHLFDERGVARGDATVRGYWKHGRAGT